MIKAADARYPPLIRLLIGGSAFVVMARAMSMPFLAIYLSRRMGLDPATIGLVIGGGALVGALGGLVGGHLSDVWGRKRVLIGCLVASGLSFPLLAASSTELQIFLINCVISLASSFYEPVAKAVISDSLPPDQRLKAFARRYVAVNIGFAVGPPIGAAIGLLETSLTFAVTGGVYVLFAAALLLTARSRSLAPGDATAGADGRSAGWKAALRFMAKDTSLLLFTLGSLLATSVHGQMSVTFSQYLNGAFADGITMFAWLMSLNAVTVILSQPPLSRWSERRPPLTPLVWGALLLSVGALGFAHAAGMAALAVAMVVFTWGEVLLVPAEYAILDAIAPASRRGLYYGTHSLNGAGNLLGPWIGGAILSRHGGPLLFYTMAMVALASMVVFVLGARLRPASVPRMESQWS
jgi:MFS family permease